MEINFTDFSLLLKLLADCIIISSDNEENTTQLDIIQYILDNVDYINDILESYQIETYLYYDENEILVGKKVENVSREAIIEIIKQILIYSTRYRIFSNISNQINGITEKYSILVFPLRADPEGFPQEFKISNNNRVSYFNPWS